MESPQSPDHQPFFRDGIESPPTSSSFYSGSPATSSITEESSSNTDFSIQRVHDNHELKSSSNLETIINDTTTLSNEHHAHAEELKKENTALRSQIPDLLDAKQKHEERESSLEDQLYELRLDQVFWIDRHERRILELLQCRERLQERSQEYVDLMAEHGESAAETATTERRLRRSCVEKQAEITRLRLEGEGFRQKTPA
ncbi:hypothetical protein M409DRAFT_57900 [Zasmidium cellare ATCC 36951]|uniref:Uncharacterized protein n=1 Tax=Zasmidium cellare ATCC 36951 TaxID=1080233 RepID=A0A6A6C715_ZASCE|nr:uncharacterized protein M409DRAFT_57900 [Zasmidium cellare ATCC 36951]KAF2162841.1 hypothetical protein M409DRAFT_57900 [Zasmidium cellare ATCC 36951]